MFVLLPALWTVIAYAAVVFAIFYYVPFLADILINANASLDEWAVFALSVSFTYHFFLEWYKHVSANWHPKRNGMVKFTLTYLPVIALVVMLHTLRFLASFDVVNSWFWISFYILLGYTWLWLGMFCMFYFFDISWIDDGLNLNNKAALPVIAGGFLGLTVIYSGANIGDGPGWWCVIFAGGLGFAAWFLLGAGICRTNDMSERITVERDLGCGIRFGSYLLANGIILGRASGGDWTSFYMTIVEFFDVYDRWPVLLLAAVEMGVEKTYFRRSTGDGTVFSSIVWGVLYIIFAVVIVMQLVPALPHNPIWRVGA